MFLKTSGLDELVNEHILHISEQNMFLWQN